MTRFRFPLALVLAGMTAAMLRASSTGQERPDFTGTWVATKDAPSGIAAAPSPVMGARVWLDQKGDRVTVIRPYRDTAIVAAHVIGEETRSRVPGATCLGDTILVTKVEWDGPALVHRFLSTQAPGAATPAPSALRHVLRLAAADTLVIETQMRSPQSGEPVPVATVYKKQADAPPPVVAAPVATPAPATLGQLGWLTGTWATEGATLIEERWTPAAGSMLGTSRTVRAGSMSAFEFLCIAERHGGLVYTAMPNARTPATDFQLTALDETSATFENPSHDFPKKIRYALRPDGALEAIISGAANQKPITFVFKKQ